MGVSGVTAIVFCQVSSRWSAPLSACTVSEPGSHFQRRPSGTVNLAYY